MAKMIQNPYRPVYPGPQFAANKAGSKDFTAPPRKARIANQSTAMMKNCSRIAHPAPM
jgi:hypothetical protein